MFLIKKIGFDNMENYNPEYEEIIGVIDCTEEEAERWINAHNEILLGYIIHIYLNTVRYIGYLCL